MRVGGSPVSSTFVFVLRMCWIEFFCLSQCDAHNWISVKLLVSLFVFLPEKCAR
jgi:hypothetical protein